MNVTVGAIAGMEGQETATLAGWARLADSAFWSGIWDMSWPLLLTTISCCFMDVIHVHIAGLLGPVAQATVGLCDQLLMLFVIFMGSVGVGATAVVSRMFGAQRLQEAALAAAQALGLALFIGTALALIVSLASKAILPLVCGSQQMIDAGCAYLNLAGIYLIPFSLVSATNALSRATGNAQAQLQIMLLMTTIDLLMNFLTVSVGWPVPDLGLKGIAVSAITASTVASILALVQLRKSVLGESLRRFWSVSPSLIQRILRIGLPSSLQELAWASSAFVFFSILSLAEHPTEALASWTIGIRMEAFVFLPLTALGLAVTAIVGHNIGANQMHRAWLAGWSVAWIGIALMIAAGTVLFVFAEPLAGLTSHNHRVVEFTANYLRINAVGEPFLALEMILSGALQGIGDTGVPMLISFVSNWVIRLPLAAYLVVRHGPSGAWFAMTASNVVSGLLIAWRFQSRRSWWVSSDSTPLTHSGPDRQTNY